jgi:hypothetical protein
LLHALSFINLNGEEPTFEAFEPLRHLPQQNARMLKIHRALKGARIYHVSPLEKLSVEEILRYRAHWRQL